MIELNEQEQYALEIASPHDLHLFNRYLFAQMRSFKWLDNWHHHLMCEKLEAVYNGTIKRLIINIPPRYSKTELAVIAFTAWALGKSPDSEFIHASYSATLANKNSTNLRSVLQHEAYQRIFNTRLASGAKTHLTTTDGGTFYTVGVGGTLTGFGAGKQRKGFGGAIIIDDPHKANEASSDTLRSNVIEWFQNTLESRVNTADTPIIVIMQRLHEQDLTGWLLSGGNGEQWDSLILPAINESDEALWPAKHDIYKLKSMKASNSYVFNGQYMQNPSQIGGQHIKGAWFKRYHTLPPDIKRVFIAADTAQKIKEYNDYSVFGVWAESTDRKLFLIDIIRGKWEAPELERTARDIWSKYAHMRPSCMAIEDKASGSSLIQYIRRANYFPVKPIQVENDKFTRLLGVQGYIESGFIYLPEGASWVSDFIAECEAFTANNTHAHDDQIDMLTMGITYAKGELTVWDVL